MSKKKKASRPYFEKPTYSPAIRSVLTPLSHLSASQIAEKTWVSTTTIRNWRKGYENGGVRHPQFSTLAAVAEVAGLEFILVRKTKR